MSPEEVVGRLTEKERKLAEVLTPEQIKESLEWNKPGPIADYSHTLFVNNRFKSRVGNIEALLRSDKTIYCNTTVA